MATPNELRERLDRVERDAGGRKRRAYYLARLGAEPMPDPVGDPLLLDLLPGPGDSLVLPDGTVYQVRGVCHYYFPGEPPDEFGLGGGTGFIPFLIVG